ncbi:uncharacterized protein LOC143288969 isoform X2 [Babylonia areolata]|uniref:uncharacterized protein LOC143288969 isoform X2 n=1 Tax=Babylonia areolata TaxID=304850 RepID=UPI003FCFDC93
MIRTLLFLCCAATLAFAGPVVTEEELCNLCSDVVKDVEAAFNDEQEHAGVAVQLERVCDAVGRERREECADVLNGLTDDILYHLLQDMTPSDLCVAMTACPASTDVHTQQVPRNVQRVEEREGKGEDACEVCELLVQVVDAALRNKSSPAAANATVYKFCDSLPHGLHDTCITFAPLIVDMLVQGVDPVGACTNIGLCLDAPVPVHQEYPSVNNMQAQLPSDGPYCELCELLVQEVDKYLAENSTEAAINATVYKLCNDLPDSIKDTCLSLAPLVVTTLSNGVDPKQACTFLTLCSSSELPSKVKRVSDGPVCELCELLVQEVDKYLAENSTEAAINATVYKLCNDLPDSIKDTCLSLAPLVVTTLSNGVDPKQACTFLTLCSSSDFKSPSNVKRVSDGLVCELCELLVQEVDKYLAENSTEAAINATVYKLCNDLPDSIKDTCLLLAPLVVTTLSNGVDPKQACTFLKLCSSSDFGSSSNVKRVSDGPYCELCELLVQEIDKYLAENSTEAAINATINKLCNDLPDSIKDTCLSLAPLVVTTLSNGVDPKQACTFLTLCSSSDFEPHSAVKRVSDGPVCELCELLVQEVDKYLAENSTEAAINATVYKLCNDLPDSIKDTCLSLAPLVVTTLSNGVDPKQACTFLTLCSSSDFESPSNVKRVSDGPVCELCELLVQEVDKYLAENSTEAAINATVYKLCNDLPDSIKDTCLSLAPLVVTTLSNGVDPKQACTFLTLCSSSGVRSGPNEELREAWDAAVAKIHVNWCTVCTDHIAIIDQDLYKEEPAVQHLLDEICHRLPPPTDQACLNAADGMFPEIYEKFLNGTGSAENVCKLLGVCPN